MSRLDWGVGMDDDPTYIQFPYKDWFLGQHYGAADEDEEDIRWFRVATHEPYCFTNFSVKNYGIRKCQHLRKQVMLGSTPDRVPSKPCCGVNFKHKLSQSAVWRATLTGRSGLECLDYSSIHLVDWVETSSTIVGVFVVLCSVYNCGISFRIYTYLHKINRCHEGLYVEVANETYGWVVRSCGKWRVLNSLISSNMSYRCYEARPLLGVITRRKLACETEAVVNGMW